MDPQKQKKIEEIWGKVPVSNSVSNTAKNRVAELRARQEVSKKSKDPFFKATNPNRSIPGSDTAVSPVSSPDTMGEGFKNLAKTAPNALGDIWNLVKEGTYGTVKKVVHDIPKEAYNLVKEQGIGDAYKNYVSSVPGAIKDTAVALIPQSAKELANTDALKEIPNQFKELVKQNNGSYANALVAAVKEIPGSIPESVENYLNQIDRAVQSVENHPVNEFLGYLGLKSLGNIKPKGVVEKPVVEGTIVPPKEPPGPSKPEIAKMFKEEGIEPPISAITDSQVLRGGEALASKGVFGTKVRDTAVKAIEEVDKRTNELVEKIKPGKTLSDEGLGKVVKEGLDEYKRNFNLSQEKMYGEFLKVYGKSKVPARYTKDTLQTILEQQSLDQFGGIDKRLSNMLDRITGRNNPEIKELMGQIDEFKSKGKGNIPKELVDELNKLKIKYDKKLDFTELKETRTAIGEALEREPQNSALKRIYGSLSQDMESAVRQIGDQSPLDQGIQAAVDSFNKLNESFKNGTAKIESNIAQSISQSNPESIAHNLLTRNSAETIKTVKEIIGPERFSKVKQSFLNEILEGSRKVTKKRVSGEEVIRDKFDVSKLKKKMAEYDQETLEQIFTPDQLKELNESIKQLEKYDVMAESLKAGQAMAEGSQTAFLTKLSALTTATATGQFWATGAILFGDLALRTLFGSPFGKKLLVEGLTKPNLKALNDLKNLSEANKQLIIQNMRLQGNDNLK